MPAADQRKGADAGAAVGLEQMHRINLEPVPRFGGDIAGDGGFHNPAFGAEQQAAGFLWCCGHGGEADCTRSLGQKRDGP